MKVDEGGRREKLVFRSTLLYHATHGALYHTHTIPFSKTKVEVRVNGLT